jgi:hypothetical protein
MEKPREESHIGASLNERKSSKIEGEKAEGRVGCFELVLLPAKFPDPTIDNTTI